MKKKIGRRERERETGAEVRHLSSRTDAGAQAYVTKHCAVLLSPPRCVGEGNNRVGNYMTG